MTIYDFFEQAVLHHEKYVTDTLCEDLPENFYDTIQDTLQLIKDSSSSEITNTEEAVK
tara:strand:+ start:200 stop:373 length:174 start_codon:yes stop_codon:yes gene_type:complete